MADTSKRSTAKKSTSRSKNNDASQDNPELQASDDVRTAIISGLQFGTKAVQYAVVDGRAIFEGDIDLGSVEDLEKSNDAVRGLTLDQESVVLPGSQFRWPGGVVPYEIDSAMPDQQRVHDAIAHWEQNTVIRFVQRTSANASSHPNFVRFMHGGGCSSAVGMQGGQQNITMGTGCDAGRGIHEIGHAVGLWHEQSREDRDMFVTIQWQNIQAGKEHNFNQHITDGDDVGPYDYGSIMHYERTAFTKNGQETVTPTNPANAQIGQRVALSQGDLNAIATLYGAPVGVKKIADDGGGTIRFKKFADDGPIVLKKPNDDPPVIRFKKIRDDGPIVVKKPSDDPPIGLKKVRDDNLVPVKKLRDDVPVVVEPQFPRPPIGPLRPGGISPFLLASGHHAAIAGGGDPGAAEFEAAVGAALGDASQAVEEARRNVVALQTALTGATSELARAQEAYDALAASIQSSQ